MGGFAVSLIVYCFYRILFSTIRVEEVHRPQIMLDSLQKSQPLVYAHWHGDEWLLFSIWRKRPMAVLASMSEQGERMNRFLRWMGFQVYRGSSSKGGAQGLRALVRAMKLGSSTSLAVDGPRGPRHEVKSGVIQLAHLSKSPIIPVVATCSNAWVLKRSWNQARIPKPFSSVEISYGPPIWNLRDHELSRQFLERQLRLASELRT